MKPGEAHLREVIHRQQQRTRRDDPRPYDNDWGWWVEARLERLENAQLWLIRIAAGALAAEIIRILLQTTGLAP
ncbi:MAG: hypothetical protein ACOC7N_06075 [Chloroflexota bacterium]